MHDRRIVVLVIGVLAIQLGFIGSYVGAFHRPTPHQVPIAVVAPAGTARQVAAALDNLPGHPVKVATVRSEEVARERIADESSDGALVLAPTGDRVLVASGGGGALSEAVAEVGQAFAASQHRPATVTDVTPANSATPTGYPPSTLSWAERGRLPGRIPSRRLHRPPAPGPPPGLAPPRRPGCLLGPSPGIGGAVVVGAIGSCRATPSPWPPSVPCLSSVSEPSRWLSKPWPGSSASAWS